MREGAHVGDESETASSSAAHPRLNRWSMRRPPRRGFRPRHEPTPRDRDQHPHRRPRPLVAAGTDQGGVRALGTPSDQTVLVDDGGPVPAVQSGSVFGALPYTATENALNAIPALRGNSAAILAVPILWLAFQPDTAVITPADVTANPWPGRAALVGLVLLVAAVAVDGESHEPANLSGKSAT
jgi:hypothetical protein